MYIYININTYGLECGPLDYLPSIHNPFIHNPCAYIGHPTFQRRRSPRSVAAVPVARALRHRWHHPLRCHLLGESFQRLAWPKDLHMYIYIYIYYIL